MTTTVNQFEETNQINQNEETNQINQIEETNQINQIEETYQINQIEKTVSIEGALVGPRGPKGDPGIQQTLIRTAASDISALNVVGVNSSYEVVPVTWDDVDMANKIVGIATVAGSPGDDIEILSQGYLQDSYFSFDTGRVYVGPNSMPTQTVPSSGQLLQSIGVSTDTDTILLDLSIPLIRN